MGTLPAALILLAAGAGQALQAQAQAFTVAQITPGQYIGKSASSAFKLSKDQLGKVLGTVDKDGILITFTGNSDDGIDLKMETANPTPPSGPKRYEKRKILNPNFTAFGHTFKAPIVTTFGVGSGHLKVMEDGDPAWSIVLDSQ